MNEISEIKTCKKLQILSSVQEKTVIWRVGYDIRDIYVDTPYIAFVLKDSEHNEQAILINSNIVVV